MPRLDLEELNNSQNTSEQQSIVPKKYNRPRTARRAPPKIKSAIMEEDEMNDNDNDDNNILIIDDGNKSNESDVDNLLANEIEEEDAKELTDLGFKLNEDKHNSNEMDIEDEDDDEDNTMLKSTNDQHGKLVRDIMDAQKNKNTGIKLTTKLGQHMKSKKDKLDIDNLRQSIQKLCQTCLPLSKCIDLVFEDINVMNNQINKWKSKIDSHKNKLNDERRLTLLMTDEYKLKIDAIQRKIENQKELNLEKRAELIRNEKVLSDTIYKRLLLLVPEDDDDDDDENNQYIPQIMQQNNTSVSKDITPHNESPINEVPSIDNDIHDDISNQSQNDTHNPNETQKVDANSRDLNLSNESIDNESNNFSEEHISDELDVDDDIDFSDD